MGSLQPVITPLKILRSDEHWNTVLKETSDIAAVVGVNLEDEVEQTEATQRRRKVSKKIDENPDTEAELTLMEKIRVKHYLPAIDKISTKLNDRFGTRRFQVFAAAAHSKFDS